MIKHKHFLKSFGLLTGKYHFLIRSRYNTYYKTNDVAVCLSYTPKSIVSTSAIDASRAFYFAFVV